jgi:hypothetical protein
MARGFFQDGNGDWSMSRLNQFLIVTGGLALAGMALYYGRDGADLIFASGAAAAGYGYGVSRKAESKENIVDKAAPVDVEAKINA